MKKGFLAAIVLVVIAAVVLLVLFLTGVLGGAPEPAEPVVFQFALSGSPDTLDPHATAGTLTFQVIRSVYDTLVEPDLESKIVPALAESWSISSDNMVWEFSLRRGVTFHNGDALTSADVKATLERAMSTDRASSFEVIESISTPDDHTVVLTLSEPSAPLLADLASGWGAILPASLIDAGHDFATQPVGTGPFSFVEWVQDSRIVLEKNDDYWMDGAPMLDGVTFNIVPEAAVRAQGLISGDFHAIESFNTADKPMLEADPEVTIARVMSSLVFVLSMNSSREPFDDPAMRQAVAHAVDKQTVMDVAYGGGVTISTFMDYANPYYVDFPGLYDYDPALAVDILDSSDYDDSEPLVMVVPSNYDAHVKAAEMYHQMLTDVGFNVELRLLDWSTWLSDAYRGGNFDLNVIAHTGKLDPQGRLGSIGTDSYYIKWVDDRTHELIEQAGSVIDFEQRRALYAEALERIAEAVPQVYVGTSYREVAMRENVAGFHQDVQIDTYDFRYTELR